MGDASWLPLPPGRSVELPGRGTTFIREVKGPSGAPTLLLLHGWTANADLNWATSFEALGTSWNVVALDHRGHSRGISDHRPFTLEACADDAAALIDVLGLRSVIAVGYSMGGPVAKLLWRRHRQAVDGLVLCATSRTFNDTPRERALFSLLAGASLTARRVPLDRRARIAMRIMAGRRTDPERWQWACDDLASHDWLKILQAGQAIGRFDSRSWAHTIDVPTAVVVTLRDRIVPPTRQFNLAASIPGATVHPVAGDHGVCLEDPTELVPHLVEAIAAVEARIAVPVPARATRLAAAASDAQSVVERLETAVDAATGADEGEGAPAPLRTPLGGLIPLPRPAA